MTSKSPLSRALSSSVPNESTHISPHLQKMNSLQNSDSPENDPDNDYFLDQSSVTFTEDFPSSLMSISNMDTLTPSQTSLVEPDDLIYHKKSYHKCNAENRDPRCVCSAKLGLDFPNLPDDNVFNEPSSDHHTSKLPKTSTPDDKNLTLSVGEIDQTTTQLNISSDAPTTPDDPGFMSKDLGDTGSSLDQASRRSSIDSEYLDSKDKNGTQFEGAKTDSGVGSLRSGKVDSNEIQDDTTSSLPPLTPRELSNDHFSSLLSPKSSYDSDPEESSSLQGTYRKTKRRTLSDSESSWSSSFSSNGYLNELVAECERFMKIIATKIFNPLSDITQQEKSRFGQLCQHGAGRQWFAKYVNEQRQHNTQCLDELVFYRLHQFFSVCLFECDHEDDYVPAKCLMLLCFVFYTDLKPPHKKLEYLFSGIRTQPIWRSLKFWNAAFFDAVHCEGVHRGPNGSRWQSDVNKRHSNAHNSNSRSSKQDHHSDMFSGIVFKQLKEFTKYMHQLEVPKELNVEFLVKQSMVGKLSEDQTCTLREFIEHLYNVPSID